MFYQYDNEAHEAKARDVLAALGEFTIAFERVCAEMRSCISCAFRREGLKNQGLSQIVVNKATAEPLRTALGGIYSELNDQDEEDKKHVKNLLSRIDRLSTTRNKLLHAEWFLNYDYEGANENFIALALKRDYGQNNGAYALKIAVTKNTLEQHTREATEILVLLRRLVICLNQKDEKVSEMFSRPL